MIVLHGLGDSMEGYRWMPKLLRLSWLNYLLVNAPDVYYGGFSWYDFAGDPGPGVRRSRELIRRLLDQQRELGFRSERTILFGFSQGCLMTLDTGLRYPERLAGLVGISGYVFEPEKLVQELSPAARSQRVLMTHGTQDHMIPLASVRAQVELLKSAGINLEWHEFRKGHTIAGEEELSLIRDFVRTGLSES
jgi:phospholipase/carboxylesterase